MPNYEPLDYRLRCHSKRTDLPPDVLRDICEAYEYMELLRDELTERIHMCDMRSEKILELTAERDEARRIACDNEARHNSMMFDSPKHSDPCTIAESRDWNCYKDAPVVKTLNGVVVSKGKAVPPKFDLEEDRRDTSNKFGTNPCPEIIVETILLQEFLKGSQSERDGK